MGVSALPEKASLQELQVHFIIQPESDMVVGYVAIKPPSIDGPFTLPVLLQCYVDAEYRQRGMASGALRVLLAGYECFEVEASIDASHGQLVAQERLGRILARLGFAAVAHNVGGCHVTFARLGSTGTMLLDDGTPTTSPGGSDLSTISVDSENSENFFLIQTK